MWVAEQAVLLGRVRETGGGKGMGAGLGYQWPKARMRCGKKQKRRWASSVVGLEREWEKEKKTFFSFFGFFTNLLQIQTRFEFKATQL